MQNNSPTDKALFSDFTTDQVSLIKRALSIIEFIPIEPNSHLPKSIDVAEFLDTYNVDVNTVLATLLTDPRLAKSIIPLDIKAEFGETVAILVKDVNWLNSLKIYSPAVAASPHEAERVTAVPTVIPEAA